MLSVIVFIFLLPQYIFGAQVPICRGIEYSGIAQNPNQKTMLSFSYNLDVTFNKQNLTFPNTVITSNFTINSLGFEYFDSDQQIDYGYSVGTDETVNMLITNYIPLPNMALELNHRFRNLDTCILFSTTGITLFIKDGTIFDGRDGSFMDESNNFCLNSFFKDCGIFEQYDCIETACCTNIDYIEIPDVVDETCDTFETKAIVPTTDVNEVAVNYTFHALYTITSDKNFTIFITVNKNILFMFNPLDLFVNDCSDWYFNDFTNLTCRAQFPTNDFEWPLNLNVKPNKIVFIVGDLIRRNGTFFKNSNLPFTSEDPCSNSSGEKYKSTFCCTHFRNVNPVITTTPEFRTSLADDEISSTETFPIRNTKTSTKAATKATTTEVSSADSLHGTLSLLTYLFMQIFFFKVYLLF